VASPAKPGIAAIRTEYGGQSFRSRLEAHWACFFDALGWPWEYEPFDLHGYIPDFILRLHRPVLIEVKPEMEFAALGQHMAKIDASGWDAERDAIVVGACLFDESDVHWGMPDGPALGLSREGLSPAPLMMCASCHRPSFYDTNCSWACRVCGFYDGGRTSAGPLTTALHAWRQTAARVQWRPR